MEGGSKELLFIHGYGGNLEQPGVIWLMERFKQGGYTVTYVQLPTVIKDFKNDILQPVSDIQDSLSRHVVAGFSLGGLTAAYLEKGERKVYLSPFWGINDRWAFKGLGSVLRILAGFNKPSLKRHFEKEDAGPLAASGDMNGIPDHVDPRTIHEMHHAQIQMPEPDPGDVVYYCEKDSVISIKSIERRNIEKHTFQGGHMFYLSRERKELMKDIIASLDEGFKPTRQSDMHL
jgi:hypothetical protein